MKKVSVVMPTYNSELYVAVAIESVLNQSFPDFEFIIVDDGSTDRTVSIISSYKDKRIKLVRNEHNFIKSLNTGIDMASTNYIARMDADDIMHAERLNIQYSIMKSVPSISVCSSWFTPFGKDVLKGVITSSYSGLLKYPLLLLLERNFIVHPSVMLRKNFLDQNNLRYSNYKYAEDYKLWADVARNNGLFFIDSQPLLFYRISNEQVSCRKALKQNQTAINIRKEILNYIIEQNVSNFSSLGLVLDNMFLAKKEELLGDEDILNFFFQFLSKNKCRLKLDDFKKN